MDAAWALYEAWVAIQTGDVDSALIYGFGKASLGDLHEIWTLQTDPYTVAPLWPSMVDMAALQADAYIAASGRTERDLAEVAARSLRNAQGEPARGGRRGRERRRPARSARHPPAAARLRHRPDHRRRRRDRDRGRTTWPRQHCERPGLDPGHRAPGRPPAPRAAGPGHGALGRLAAAEAAGVADGADRRRRDPRPVQPRGADPPRGAGSRRRRGRQPLGRRAHLEPDDGGRPGPIGEVADRIIDGRAGRGVAHAAQGPCLQQNLVCVLEGASHERAQHGTRQSADRRAGPERPGASQERS